MSSFSPRTFFIILNCLALATTYALDSKALSDTDKVLSRHRRFIVPSSTGWTLTTKLKLTVPVDLIGSSVSFSVPFVYSFDSSTLTGRGFAGESENEGGFLLSGGAEHELHRLRLLRSVENRLVSSPHLAKVSKPTFEKSLFFLEVFFLLRW